MKVFKSLQAGFALNNTWRVLGQLHGKVVAKWSIHILTIKVTRFGYHESKVFWKHHKSARHVVIQMVQLLIFEDLQLKARLMLESQTLVFWLGRLTGKHQTFSAFRISSIILKLVKRHPALEYQSNFGISMIWFIYLQPLISYQFWLIQLKTPNF
jgi:hypothetical protein